MKIICLIKFVPDVDNFKYDYENNVLIRENVRLLLNPDDACAVSAALKLKAEFPETFIEIVSMAPTSVKPHVEDLLRLGVDRSTLISDRLFAGSDTYATSKVLARHLSKLDYNAIFTGTHAIDGDTAHIPPQIGAILNLNQMSGIVSIHEDQFSKDSVVFDVETEDMVTTYEIKLPAVLSFSRESKYKLPYVKRQDIGKDVSDSLFIISNKDLRFDPEEIGLKGSRTKVVKTYTKKFDKKDQILVQTDQEGIDFVYNYLKEKGFIA